MAHVDHKQKYQTALNLMKVIHKAIFWPSLGWQMGNVLSDGEIFDSKTQPY